MQTSSTTSPAMTTTQTIGITIHLFTSLSSPVLGPFGFSGFVSPGLFSPLAGISSFSVYWPSEQPRSFSPFSVAVAALLTFHAPKL